MLCFYRMKISRPIIIIFVTEFLLFLTMPGMGLPFADAHVTANPLLARGMLLLFGAIMAAIIWRLCEHRERTRILLITGAFFAGLYILGLQLPPKVWIHPQLPDDTLAQIKSTVSVALLYAIGAALFTGIVRIRKHVQPERVGIFMWPLLFTALLAASVPQFISNASRVHNLNLDEPLPAAYLPQYDPTFYWMVFDKMERGMSYAEAAKQAFDTDTRTPEGFYPPGLAAWRFPTKYFIWTTFTDTAYGVFILYLIGIAVIFLCIHLITLRVAPPEFGAIGMWMLMPFVQTNILDLWFFMTDWWGIFPFMLGFTALLYKRHWLAIIFFSLALITRENILIPLAALSFLLLILKRWRLFLTMGIPVAAMFLMIVFHYFNLHYNLRDLIEGSLFHQLGSYVYWSRITRASYESFWVKGILWNTLRHGNFAYFFYTIALPLFFILALCGTARAILKKQRDAIIIIGTGALTALAMFHLGTPTLEKFEGSIYWNILYVPIIASGIGIFLWSLQQQIWQPPPLLLILKTHLKFSSLITIFNTGSDNAQRINKRNEPCSCGSNKKYKKCHGK